MIEFDIEPDGGDPYRLTADSRDVYAWEKTSRSNETFTELMDGMRMTALYRLAHIASRRQGMFGGTLDEFAATCILHFDADAQEQGVDPTQPGPTPGNSSSSPSSPTSRPRSGRKKATGQ